MIRCTFEIPTSQWSGQMSRLLMTEKDAIEDLGQQIINRVLDVLGIPDSESCQVRVVAKETPGSRTLVSLTGLDEHRDYSDQDAYIPAKEQILSACVVTQALGQESALKVGLTSFELWKDTTFTLVGQEASSEARIEPEAKEIQEGISQFIKNPKITLVISTGIAEKINSNHIEVVNAGELYLIQAKELAELTASVLGLPETGVEAGVIVAMVAGADFSVEFDCQTECGYNLSASSRRYLAQRLERYLISNQATRVGSAEVWIRQNTPETVDVYARPFHSSVAETQEDIEAAHKLRNQVFVGEQKVPEELEVDEYDKTATHVIVKQEQKVVGTGRLVVEKRRGKIGRVAVDVEYRHQDIGTWVMVRLEEEARRMGLDEIYLHAQTYASKFYRLLGYKSRGETLYEAGIEHIEMYKKK